MAKPISARQLTCIQALWSRRMHAAGVLDRAEARAMRHQYIQQLTAGRASETKELSADDAMRVILSLQGRRPIADGAAAHAAGTHGRRGHDDGRLAAMASPDQIAMLLGYAERLGWDRGRLDAFIDRQLGSGRSVRTVRDVNRILWGLKAMLRRHRPRS